MNLFMQMLLATPKITNIFSNTSKIVTEAGGGFIAMFGVILIVVGAVFFGSNLLAKGQPKTPWGHFCNNILYVDENLGGVMLPRFFLTFFCL